MEPANLPLTVELHQTIIRADGTVEELGCVATTEDNTVTVHEPSALQRWLQKKKEG